MATCLTRSADALDAVLDGLPADPLRHATASLIDAYRSGAPPTAQVLRDPTTAAAYAAYRMPATHAAVSRALRHATDLAPGLGGAHAGRRGWGHGRGDLGGGRGLSARWSGRRCSTGRPTRWPSARGSGGTGRRRWRGATWSGRCSAPGVALPAGRPRGRQLPARRACRAAARAGGRRGGGGGGAAGARRRARHPARVRRGAGGALPAHRRGVAPAGALPAGRRVPGGRPARRLVPLRGAAGPQRAAPAGQGRPARPRGREVLLRAGLARARWRPPGVGCCGIRSPARAWCSSRSALRRGPRSESWSRNATRSPTVQHATPRGGVPAVRGRTPAALIASKRSIPSIKGVT